MSALFYPTEAPFKTCQLANINMNTSINCSSNANNSPQLSCANRSTKVMELKKPPATQFPEKQNQFAITVSKLKTERWFTFVDDFTLSSSESRAEKKKDLALLDSEFRTKVQHFLLVLILCTFGGLLAKLARRFSINSSNKSSSLLQLTAA